VVAGAAPDLEHQREEGMRERDGPVVTLPTRHLCPALGGANKGIRPPHPPTHTHTHTLRLTDWLHMVKKNKRLLQCSVCFSLSLIPLLPPLPCSLFSTSDRQRTRL